MMRMVLFFIFTSIHAQDVSQIFTQANQQYENKNCAQALALYEQIPDKGAATWYNMGNCAYKLNDQIHALLYWKRAYKYGMSIIRNGVRQNIKLLSIPYTSPSRPFATTSPLLMQILFFCLFSIFLIVGYFLIQAKRWIFLAMSLSVLVSAGRITYEVYSASAQALVMYDNSALRAGPGTEYHQIQTIPAGTTVTLLKQKNGWAQISVDTTKGWIENKQIEKI